MLQSNNNLKATKDQKLSSSNKKESKRLESISVFKNIINIKIGTLLKTNTTIIYFLNTAPKFRNLEFYKIDNFTLLTLISAPKNERINFHF